MRDVVGDVFVCIVLVFKLCRGEHVKHTHPWGIGLFCTIPEHLFV